MQKVKLKEIIGKAISGEWGTDDIDGTGVPVLRTANFTNNGVISYKNVILRNLGAKVCSEKFLHHGDIIIEKSGGSDKQPVGRVVYFDGENNKYLFNNFTALLRVKDQDKWSTKYVFYYLFNSYAKGNTLKFQNKTTGLHNLQLDNYINSLCVFEITYNEQIYIVNEIDKVVDLIEKRKKQIEKLDELVRSRFVEMFGDPIRNEKGWIYEILGNVCLKIIGGGTPSKSCPEYYKGNIPWVTPKDMKTNIIEDSIDHISENAINKSTTNVIPVNSVLMVIRSGILKHSLPIAINRKVVTINQDMKAFVPNNRISAIYLMFYFKSIESNILNGVRAVTADNIDFKDFVKRKISLPPIELQNKFAEFVEKVEKTKSAIKKSLYSLETLKKSLMQKYFG